MTARSRDEVADLIRGAISNAYYEARNAGETMETAADNARDAVMAILDEVV